MRHSSLILLGVLASSAVVGTALVACGSSNDGSPGVVADGGPDAAPSVTDAGPDTGPTPDAGDAASPAHSTVLPAISFDVVNVGLDGVNAPFAAARRTKLFADLAARSSDVMCVFDAADSSDRTAIAAAAATAFPSAYTIVTTATTPPSNPPDVHPAPASAPCGGTVSSTTVGNAYSCIDANCSTVSGGDPSGTGDLNGTTACLSQSCTAPLTALYSSITASSSPAAIANDACFDCLLFNVLDPSETIAQGQQTCTQTAAASFAFAGQAPAMILSKYPITGQTSYVLPSSGFRRQVLKVQVELPNQGTVDVFCAQLTSPLNDESIPYTGSYGSDVGSDGGLGNGWRDEQDLQAAEAVAYIEAQVAIDGLPAIVGTDLHSDAPPAVAVIDAGVSEDAGPDAAAAPVAPSLTPLSPEVQLAFDDAKGFIRWVAPGAPETCDFCPSPQNVYNSQPESYELLHAYALGTLPAKATLSETLWGTDNGEVTLPANVPDQPPPAGGTGPILTIYGHNYALTLAP